MSERKASFRKFWRAKEIGEVSIDKQGTCEPVDVKLFVKCFDPTTGEIDLPHINSPREAVANFLGTIEPSDVYGIVEEWHNNAKEIVVYYRLPSRSNQ